MKKVVSCILVISMLLGIAPVFAAESSGTVNDFYLLDTKKRANISDKGMTPESKDVYNGAKYSAKMVCSQTKGMAFDTISDVKEYTTLKFAANANMDCQVYILLRSENPETTGADYYGMKLNLKAGWREYKADLAKFVRNRQPLGYDQIGQIAITTTGYSMQNDLDKLEILWSDIYLTVDEDADSLKPTPPPTPEPVVTASPVPDADIAKLSDSVVLMLGSSDAYANSELKKVDENNEKVMPEIINNRTLVPVRFISENFGADTSWDADSQTVSVTGEGKSIKLVINSDKMTVDGNEISLDAAATVINDRTFIPLRALCEALDKNVFWDSRGLIIISPKDLEIDENKDFKTVTAMVGYLKTGKLHTNYAAAMGFTQSMIDKEASLPAANSSRGANGLYYLTLALNGDSNLKTSDGTPVKDAVLSKLRFIIGGGNEPFACAGPYWEHAVFASALLLIKHTPAVYNELTQDEKDRCDWLMRALAIAGNWAYNDENDYFTGTDLYGNFKKSWNPNYRNTYLSIVWTASLYFGAKELDDIFLSFDYDEYIAKFKEYGFTNIIKKWEPAGKDLMENGGSCVLLGTQGASSQKPGDDGGSGKGVKIKFKYAGKDLSDPYDVFEALMKYTYGGGKVVSTLGRPDSNTYCYIISGAFSPYSGMDGMMYEFSIMNGKDVNRSSASYGFGNLMIINSLYANYKLLFGWDSSSEKMQALDKLMYVGNQDLIFKVENGYHGYSNGGSYDTYEHSLEPQGYAAVKDMWQKFHCMQPGDTKIKTREESLALDPNAPKFAEPFNNITTPPENAYLPGTSSGGFSDSAYRKLEKAYKGDVTSEFDLVIAPDVLYEKLDAVIMFDSDTAKNLTYKQANVLIQIKGGRVAIMNGNSYIATQFKFNANYRMHFKVKMNAQTKRYSVWITPVYPEAVDEVLAADGYDFRTSAVNTDNIGQMIMVSSPANGYWIENYTETEN